MCDVTLFTMQVKLMEIQGSTAKLNSLSCLAKGPDKHVTRYSGCIVNGVKYLVDSRDDRRITQNCGVQVEAEHNNKIIDFFGILKDVVELRYRGNNHVVLFMCEWFDSTYIVRDQFFTSIDTKRKWYKDDPYILACQSKQVFYVQDTRLRGTWRVVQSVDHRHLWDPSLFQVQPELQVLSDQNRDVYQENQNCCVDYEVDNSEVATLHRNDIDPEIVVLATAVPRHQPPTTIDDFINDGSSLGSASEAELNEGSCSFSSRSD